MDRKSKKTINLKHHFRIFSIYLGLDYSACQNQMQTFFLSPLKDSQKRAERKEQVMDWWSGDQAPQPKKSVPQINDFFKKLSEATDPPLEWNEEWLSKTLNELGQIKQLEYAYYRVVKPFAMPRYFQRFYGRKKDLLDNFTDEYCPSKERKNGQPKEPRYYLIYRWFSVDHSLACDLLKIIEADEENIFCTLYQYTAQKIIDPFYKDPEFKDVKRFQGNVFFNKHSVNISLVSVAERNDGPEYINLMIKRFDSNESELGIMTALTDKDHHPAAQQILVKKHNMPKSFNMKRINDYVRVFAQYSKDYDRIVKELEHRFIAAK